MGTAKPKKHVSITTIVVYMVIVQAVLLMAAFLFVSFFFFRRGLTQVYEEMDKSISGVAAGAVDEEAMAELARRVYAAEASMDDPKAVYETDQAAYYAAFADIQNSAVYEELRTTVNEVRHKTTSSAICYVLMHPGENYGVYIFDASDYNVLPCGERVDLDIAYLQENPEATFEAFISESPTYGNVRTNGIRIYRDENGVVAYLFADFPVSSIIGQARFFLFQTAVCAIVLTMFVCAGIVFLLRKKLVNPISEIAKIASTYVGTFRSRSGTYAESHVFEELKPEEVDEIETLAYALKEMELEMNGYLRNLDRMTTERARIDTELQLAERIQADMLPSIFPPFPERPEFDVYAVMSPAKEVGGDFYDFFLIDNDHLGLVIADVSGKGIPGALFMMMSKILVSNAAMMGVSPKEVLSLVNTAICQNNDNDMFVTVWFGIMTISTGHVVAANAGHEFPILKKKDGQYEILKDKHGFVLGGMEGMKYTEYEFDIDEEGCLFVYTDGLPEATNADNEMFGPERILEVMNRNVDLRPKPMIEEIRRCVDAFVGEAPQFDDLTMMIVKRPGIPLTDEAEETEKA